MLSTLREKKEILAESGVDYLVIVPFTKVLQDYSARRFVEEILIGRARMGELVIGYDHGFGRGREGGVDTLREIGRDLGFDVDVVEAVRIGGEPVSSSRVRRALADGDADEAARLLGRPYTLEGPVVEGHRKGRELGFPTANVAVDDPDKMLPRAGVYAAYGWVDDARLPGLLHLGPRPTFAGYASTVELHLLDWSGDLYGRTLRIELGTRLRDVERFDSVDELVAAIRADEAAGRAWFAAEG
jgi:riboflavin kinase/FMN adenylyltransferase